MGKPMWRGHARPHKLRDWVHRYNEHDLPGWAPTETPFGDIKDSGYGSGGGTKGLDA